jgi:hypothetical protein
MVMGQGSWVVGLWSWVVGRGSWVEGRGSWVEGRGLWVEGRGSWVEGRGSWLSGVALLNIEQKTTNYIENNHINEIIDIFAHRNSREHFFFEVTVSTLPLFIVYQKMFNKPWKSFDYLLIIF